MKHIWLCDGCGNSVLFRQPELPQWDYNSEQNESKNCPSCGDDMFFDELNEPEFTDFDKWKFRVLSEMQERNYPIDSMLSVDWNAWKSEFSTDNEQDLFYRFFS